MMLIYPGSFDPVTLGHIDIALRGAKLATTLVVAVLDNPNKKAAFSVTQRLEFLQDALGHVENIKIDSFSGMLVDYVNKCEAEAILRGLRNPSDLEEEAMYATYNKLLANTETVFISANPSLKHISSSAVKEVARLIYANDKPDLALDTLVTPMVRDALRAQG